MKMSPYFKVFEEEALAWEDKLNRLLSLFDVWIDVQRRWVYLEVFSAKRPPSPVIALQPTDALHYIGYLQRKR